MIALTFHVQHRANSCFGQVTPCESLKRQLKQIHHPYRRCKAAASPVGAMGAEVRGGELWALDFDGVVCNSVGESSQSAWKVMCVVQTVCTAGTSVKACRVRRVHAACSSAGIGAEVARALCAARDTCQTGRDPPENADCAACGGDRVGAIT